MKSIPTTYSGVNFRSRLEARWAAFFDQSGILWEYEPIDLQGWAPDFGLTVGADRVLVEVKPVPLTIHPETGSLVLGQTDAFRKVGPHWQDHWILCVGERPQADADYWGLGMLMDYPSGFLNWYEMNKALAAGDVEKNWKAACNLVQWKGVKA